MADSIFLPRVLGKRPPKITPGNSSRNALPSQSSLLLPQATTLPDESSRRVEPSTKLASAEEVVAAVNLMLSEYSYAIHPQLRNAIGHGFVSLERLFSLFPSSTNLLSLSSGGAPTPAPAPNLPLRLQNAAIQLIRADGHLSSRYEVRMLMTEPSGTDWSSPSHVHAQAHAGGRGDLQPGGYEIRPKYLPPDPGSGSAPLIDATTSTIYIENLPRDLKTTARIALFIKDQLPRSEFSGSEIQWISLSPPPSVSPVVTPNSHPSPAAEKFQGYAFVTFRNPTLAERFLDAWPWDRPSSGSAVAGAVVDRETTATDDAHALVVQARKIGFRALSLERWVGLRDEYLEYQRELTDLSLSRSQQPSASNSRTIPPSRPFTSPLSTNDNPQPPHTSYTSTHPHPHTPHSALDQASTPRSIHIPPHDRYPLNCLVFVRNVHPQTNKTTLKRLLSSAFDASDPNSSNEKARGKEIDYVDYQKNMDTCHIRLSHPQHSSRLASHFNPHSSSKYYQNSGLDDSPSLSPTGGGSKAISVEIVSGLKEELYWMALPERVREDAMKRLGAGGNGLEEDEPGRDARKRRRKG